jgi:hypothetical protein
VRLLLVSEESLEHYRRTGEEAALPSDLKVRDRQRHIE